MSHLVRRYRQVDMLPYTILFMSKGQVWYPLTRLLYNSAFKDSSDISSAEKYFNLTLDADGSGLVDVSEIVQWVRKVEPSPQFIIP